MEHIDNVFLDYVLITNLGNKVNSEENSENNIYIRMHLDAATFNRCLLFPFTCQLI